MALTDTHCHLDFNRFDEDRAEVITRAQAVGVIRILIPGLNLTSSRAAVKLAGSHPLLFAAVGVHPDDALAWKPQTRHELHQLVATAPTLPFMEGCENPFWRKIVAFGEIGLDYYRERAPHDLQRQVLKSNWI